MSRAHCHSPVALIASGMRSEDHVCHMLTARGGHHRRVCYDVYCRVGQTHTPAGGRLSRRPGARPEYCPLFVRRNATVAPSRITEIGSPKNESTGASLAIFAICARRSRREGGCERKKPTLLMQPVRRNANMARLAPRPPVEGRKDGRGRPAQAFMRRRVAVTRFLPFRLLWYRAASATFNMWSATFLSAGEATSRPQTPKLAVTSIF